MTLGDKWLITIIGSGFLGVVIAIIIPLLYRGNFVQIFLSFLTTIAGVFLFGLIAIIAGLMWRKHGGKWSERVTLSSIALVIISIMQAGSIPLGAIVASRDIQQAQSYCEHLVPYLDAYKTKYGKYPEKISDLDNLPHLPRLLKGEDFYETDGNNFYFLIKYPYALLDEKYRYDSDIREWRLPPPPTDNP